MIKIVLHLKAGCDHLCRVAIVWSYVTNDTQYSSVIVFSHLRTYQCFNFNFFFLFAHVCCSEFWAIQNMVIWRDVTGQKILAPSSERISYSY